MVKRLLSWIIAFFITFCALGFGLISTSVGNKILASFVQSGLNYILPLQVQVEALHMRLGTLQAHIIIEDSLRFDIKGVYSLEGFDLALHLLDSSHIINMQGRAFGKYSHYNITLQSPNIQNPRAKNILQFVGDFHFLHPLNITFSGSNANIQEILTLINQNTIEGNFNFSFNWQHNRFDLQAISRDSILMEQKTPLYISVNKADDTITQHLKIIFNDRLLRLESTSIIQDKNITTEATFINAEDEILAVLRIPQMQDNKGIFHLSFLNLQLLGKELGMRYFGQLHLSGSFAYQPFFSKSLPQFMLNAQSDSFGGMLAISLKDEALAFKGTQLESSKILAALTFKEGIDALIDIEGNYNFMFKRGYISANSDNVELDPLNSYTLKLSSKINASLLESIINLSNPNRSFSSRQCSIDLAKQQLFLIFDEPQFLNTDSKVLSLSISGDFWDLKTNIKHISNDTDEF